MIIYDRQPAIKCVSLVITLTSTQGRNELSAFKRCHPCDFTRWVDANNLLQPCFKPDERKVISFNIDNSQIEYDNLRSIPTGLEKKT